MPVVRRRMLRPARLPESRHASWLLGSWRQVFRRRHFSSGVWIGGARRGCSRTVPAAVRAAHNHPLRVLLLQVIFHLHALRGIAALRRNRHRRIRLVSMDLNRCHRHIHPSHVQAGLGEMIDYALMHSGTILFAAIAGGETNNQKEMRRGSHSSIITAKPLYTELGNWLMAKRASCRLTVALLAAWLAPCALAQRGTGELRLSVRDGAGAAVAADVDLVNEAAKTRQTVELPADGRYAFKNLPFGWYRVLVTHAGFAPANELIEIRSEAPRSREIVLGIQPVETAIQVTDASTLLAASRTGPSD